jgi:hypothetical protein
MKKIIFILFIFALSVLNFNAVNAASTGNAYFTFVPSEKVIKAGEVFKLDIYFFPSQEKIDTVRARLTYPPDMLELQNAAKEAIFNYTSGGNVLNSTMGYFSYGAGIAGGTVNSGRFLTLQFKALKEGTANIILNSDSLILSEGVNKFDAKSIEAKITISGSIAKVEVLGFESYGDGELIRAASGKIYFISGGSRILIKGPSVLKKFAGIKITNVDDEVLKVYPEYKTELFINNYKNGTLLRDKITKKTYQIVNGFKKYITTPAELKKLKGKINNVDSKIIKSYPTLLEKITAAAKFKNGDLVKLKGDKKIYLVSGKNLVLIKSLTELQKYRSKKIIQISQEEYKEFKILK